MILGLIVFGMLAIIGAAGLVAIAPRRTPGAYFLPAVRTVALISAAVVYVAAIWSHT
ncbi:hypothetical protein [Streptomyces sp. V1I1]|uniref:hypothetical protein n=1 Tax=Streptomyces sp. V1I1 TaxID=3042272 RepID=UPI00278AB537|nr:hypothetical protein [Streptomyces sp. V1I1]MDQ0943289.1 hypothetical protein [Streptomyces sp. V1I1]